MNRIAAFLVLAAFAVDDVAGGDRRGIGENAIEIARWDAGTNTFVRVSRPRGYLLADAAPTT